jgi:hypothetical protein
MNRLSGPSGSGMACPPIDRDLLSKYVSYFVDSKFLKETFP